MCDVGSLPDMDVWASWAGALVAAVAAGLTLWTRWRDRPEVMWHFGLDGVQADPGAAAQLARDGRLPDMCVRVTNVGDGNAHAVSVSGIGIAAQMLELDHRYVRGMGTPTVVGWVPPSAHVLVAVWVQSTDKSDGSRAVKGDAVLHIEWTEGPVSHGSNRRQSIVLLGTDPGPRAPQRIKARTVPGLPTK